MRLKTLVLFPYFKLRQAIRVFSITRKVFGQRGKATIWLFGSPSHSNLGDQAQTYCIEQWSHEHFPEHDVFVFQQFGTKGGSILLNVLRRVIGKKDLLFCHSGYHMTELYPLHEIYSSVAKKFPDFPIVIFPQTINFSSEGEANRVAALFDAHSNCTLLCRDEISYAAAQRIFKKTKLILFPDVVTSLIGTRQYSFEREGVLLCMRNDKEAFYSPEQIEALRCRFSSVKVEMTDTTVPVPAQKIIANRKQILEETFSKYAHYRVIITDRYHGTIFSLIAGTPVVVISSTDHKLSSGVKWFPKEVFGDNITFAKDLDEAFNLAQRHLENPSTGILPPYFKEVFYDELVGKIGMGE